MEYIRNNQLNIMLLLIGVCASIIFFTHVLKFKNKKAKRSLFTVETAALIVLIADRYAYIFRGNTTELGFWMVRICNFAVFYGLFVATGCISFYIKNICIYQHGGVKASMRLNIAFLISVLGRFLLVISQFTGLFYTINEDNLYQRSPGFVICIFLHFLILSLQLSYTIQYRKLFSKRILWSLILFDILPIISALFQIFFYGISFNTFSLMVGAIVLFIFALIDINESIEESKRRENEMEEEYRESTELLFEQTIGVLSGSIDAKDKYTQGHSQRVAQYSKKLAKMLGLSKEEQREVFYAAILHDVGKIGISDSIINKEGKLTNEEYEEIKKHPEIGSEILEKVTMLPYLQYGALYHHERYDGNGYPKHLKGDDIPLIARIISVADAYDAMSSKRSYRDIIPQQHVREQIVMGIGTQFDPEIATKMIELIDQDYAYTMREKFSPENLKTRSSFKFSSYLSDFSEGMWIVGVTTTIKLKFKLYDKNNAAPSMPSLVIFDSLDNRIHTFEERIKEKHYTEFLTIRADSEVHEGDIRALRVTKTPDLTVDSEAFREASTEGMEIEYSMVRYKDHLRIILKNPFQEIEYIAAVQDSIRFSYGSITGENCDVEILSIENSEEKIEPDEIPRIAEEITYLDGPVGDIPNIMIPAWRFFHSQEIAIKDKLELTFHALSLPTARLIWHCPFIVIYSSKDHKFHGTDFQEYILVRMDGECWSESELVKCNNYVNKTLDFGDWNAWKARNKQGVDCRVSIVKSANKLLIKTEDSGLEFISSASLPEDIGDLNLVLTGDQCAITNIRIL